LMCFYSYLEFERTMSEKAPSPPRENPSAGRFLRNVILKAILLLGILSLGFAWIDPVQALGRVSLYNHLFPGRLRLPFGEDFEKSYNISILQMDAMFASHEISASDKPEDELRVLLLGDSSVWGFLLNSDQTLSAALNDRDYRTSHGEPLRFYNLGYPTMSVMKDLLLLEFAQRYEPDLILWFVTLESLPVKKQLDSPLVQYNPEPARSLMDQFQLGINASDHRFVYHTFWDRTLPGQRRELADLLRLQLLGVMWAGTQIDHVIPLSYEPLQVELSDEVVFQDFQPGQLSSEDLAFDVLQAGVRLGEGTPVIFINQPILIATGENSDLRYNSYYPCWAYDAYREMMDVKVSEHSWTYLDLWDTIPAEMFTDSAIHYSPNGVEQVVDRLSDTILRVANQIP
jgi:hypothetical protein